MKKIVISALLLAFALTGAGVSAQQGEKDNIKATDIKIHKKQTLSNDERKALEEAKGKPAVGDKKVSLPASWATGIGVPLPEGGQRYAIVAGLANYTGVVNDLCVTASKTYEKYHVDGLAFYCQDYDSVHMKQALVSQYNFIDDSDHIILLRDADATQANILEAMNGLKGVVTDKDEIVFFFSGHGVSGRISGDKEAIDEAIFTYDNNYIWDNELKAWADSLPAYRAVFAFDICLAGGMNDLAGKNRVVVMSSKETQSSWTYTLGGAAVDGNLVYSEGLFSHYFVVDGIIKGSADASNLQNEPDGDVAVEEAFSYAYPIVKVKQVPVLSDNFINDLLL